MDKYIKGVAYRHTLLTAYLKITGRTQPEAERYAKQVGTVLRQLMPPSAEVGVPRGRGVNTYEIPIVIADCERAAKAVLAQLVLQGRVAV